MTMKMTNEMKMDDRGFWCWHDDGCRDGGGRWVVL
jgi:hypothetical protein